MPDYRFGPSECPPNNAAWLDRYDTVYEALDEAVEEFEAAWDEVYSFGMNDLATYKRTHRARAAAYAVAAKLDALLKVVSE